MKKRIIQRLAVLIATLLLFSLIPIAGFADEEGHWELICAHGDACNECGDWAPAVPAKEAVINPETGDILEPAVEYAAGYCKHGHDAQGPDSMCWLWVPATPHNDGKGNDEGAGDANGEGDGAGNPPEACVVEGCQELSPCPTHGENLNPNDGGLPQACVVEGCQELSPCPTHGQNPDPDPVLVALSAPAIPSYTVAFFGWDNTKLDEQQVLEGDSAVAPDVPERTGYIFNGWSVAFDNVQSELTTIAQYTPIVYSITYQLDGGTNAASNPASYTIEDSVTLADPTPPSGLSYVFQGWSPAGSIPVGSTGDKTFAAIWTYSEEISKQRNESQLTYIHGDTIFIVHAIKNQGIYTFLLSVMKNGVWQFQGQQATGIELPKNSGTTPVQLSVNGYTITVNLHGNMLTDEVQSANTTLPGYTVTWKNEDGKVLQTDTNVAHGAAPPAYTGQTPTKTQTLQYTYTNSGWTPDPANYIVTGDVTFTATYTREPRYYKVSWVNTDAAGTVLNTYYAAYGTTPQYWGQAPTKDADAQYTYTFSGWTPTISRVTREISYYAAYTPTARTHTVTWLDDANNVIRTDRGVPHGTILRGYGDANPTKNSTPEFSYAFSHWSPYPVGLSVVSDFTFRAVFTETRRTYTVTWLDDDGTELRVNRDVFYGTMLTGYGATNPSKLPTAEFSYAFSGWSPNPVNHKVEGDITFRAAYLATTNTYTVTWENEGGAVLETDLNVTYGTIPTYNGATPIKAATAGFTYTFAGWTPAVAAITGDTTYTAVYTPVAVLPVVVVALLEPDPEPPAPLPEPVRIPITVPATQPEVEPIAPDPVPLAPPEQSGAACAVLNLILTALALGFSVYLFATIFTGKKSKKEPTGTASGKSSGMIWRILGMLAGIGSIIAFLLTQTVLFPMVLIDKWTPLMVAISAIQAAAALVMRNMRKDTAKHRKANA